MMISRSYLPATLNLADIGSFIHVSLHRHPKVGAENELETVSQEQIRKAPFSLNPEAQKPLNSMSCRLKLNILRPHKCYCHLKSVFLIKGIELFVVGTLEF